MPAGVHPRSEDQTASLPSDAPEISVCESCPGKVVFLETGNTDGWMASDTTVELER